MQMTAKLFLFRGWKIILQMASFKTLISWMRKLRTTDKQFVQGHKLNLAADANLELRSANLSPLLWRTCREPALVLPQFCAPTRQSPEGI